MYLDQRFEHHQKNRYYRVILTRDLFGDWVVTRVWGGIGKPNGRVMHVACATQEKAIELVHNIRKVRESRGYMPIKPQEGFLGLFEQFSRE